MTDSRGDASVVSTMPVKAACKNEVLGLKSPELRDSEQISLFVTVAGHPTNFLFQLAEYESDLREVEKEMSEFYNNEELEEISKHEIVKNQLFAARDSNHVWHRVMVAGSVVGGRVPVRFCDYGEVVLASVSCLRELKSEFLIRPCMAMKGRLAGVRPVEVETWSIDDCLRFEELVEDSCLVGTVVGILDHENPMERTVFLNLISNNEANVDLAEVLVNENRAIRDG